ncbi:MAG: threonine synthase [Deltaproteobacteria bacterium]|nr:threonine synthase [Deltaproteobacteria bacterium]
MRYVSTRKGSPALAFSGAVAASMAPDGGLYVPERFPRFKPEDFEGLNGLSEIAERLLAPFFENDPLAAELHAICSEVFTFPIPLRKLPHAVLQSDTSVLELFHGPTAAFKDVGARFLAACLSRHPAPGTRTVLVATSGDTGGAVAAAFHGRPGFEVVILFPKGKVSARQEKQLTAWGGNVRAFAVRGDFDDCQRVVKQAFADEPWRKTRALVSANSINIGRLLPQSVYYAAASLWSARMSPGSPAGFVVPTGNLGNAVAALWALKMGFPVGRVALATNANRPISDYFASGVWKPAATVSTLANAMDVGNPSNIERLLCLYPALDDLKADTCTAAVPDPLIAATIREAALHGEVFCPHTAVAAHVRRGLREPGWIIVATAHAAKFDTIIEPLIGRKIEVPPSLAAILARPSQVVEIEPSLEALVGAI